MNNNIPHTIHSKRMKCIDLLMMEDSLDEERYHESNCKKSKEREGDHRSIARMSCNCTKLIATGSLIIIVKSSIHITAPVPSVGTSEVTL